MRKVGLELIGFCTVLIATWAAAGSACGKVAVFVSLVPQKYFVQQIGKDLVDIQVMIPAGADFHVYEPKPKQMVAIARARLYFAIGIEFEKARLKNLTRVNPQMKVVQTDQGIQKMPMAAHPHRDKKDAHRIEAESGQEKYHPASSGFDPHVWLSPPLVKKQAHVILTALQEFDPSHSSTYEVNYQEFVIEIEALDAELKKVFAAKRGLQFMVFHPAWGYFAHTYGLQQLAVEIEGKNPKPAQLKELIEHAREIDIKVIFVQPQYSVRNAELIAREIGGQVVFADPLAENWADNLRKVAQQIKVQLK
ncbi:Zinc ABC transporter, substrate-binding protein ZnuA [Olavius sp. associated proteobacterium Delta 1]|nr:Zinc ABC transporter, substrate-binding protein ZnuA [Olavius sp. associated proteobacterium Delta 1]